ncbi:hypothetical protein [Desulfovibrio cuneatus]|uniref:hypothetical protein n=1 Tax=Desulfovibrio cuneatus TaxID=159728 RepID=UPI000403BF8E|nr:hypothetical protein [Desulfovibrio cuneatus]
MPRPLRDPRLALGLTLAASLCVWHAGWAGLCAYAAALLYVWHRAGTCQLAPQGTMARTVRFSLFWATITWAFTLSEVLPPMHWGDIATLPHALRIALPPALWATLPGAALLLCRLALLMAFALSLTLHLSPHALGRAAVWFVAPLLRQNAWKPALSLALMVHYLPAIHSAAHAVRLAARVRGLPEQGFAYWKNALPHLFRLLYSRTMQQAMAIASRGLDTNSAWLTLPPLPRHETAMALGVALFFAAFTL